jgi:hypothetical protein
MTWNVRWEAAAERTLLAIPDWRVAERIARAVHDFASTGAGMIERVATDTSAPFRLRVPPYVVRLSLEPTTRALRVWSVWRSS